MATLLCMITDFQNAPAVQNLIGYHPWNGFSVLLHVLLPLGGFVLLFGGRSFLSKVLLQFDRNCVAVCCPSLSKREKLLKWASARLPPTWSSQARTLSNGISELWKDGSLLCVLINTVVPEACPNPHRHWKKAPIHAQSLAYKYLGVTPVFTQNELLCEFSISEEKRFVHYLYKLQEAINKFPEIENRKFSSEHVARGMGLYTGERHKIATFYIYSSLATQRDCILTLYIKGSFKTEGKASFSTSHSLKVLPVSKALEDQFEATKSLPLKNDERRSFLKNISLKFESFMVKNEERIDDKIPIQIEFEGERIKISYIPNNTGIYEIHLFSEGKAFRGSPFRVNVNGNTSRCKDTFYESQRNKKVSVTKRKILSKVIDCIDEKIYIDDKTEDFKNDLTITAITQRKNEMLKTEINCALENISEENSTSDGKSSVGSIDKTTLEEMMNISQDLNSDLIQNEVVAVNSQRKVVKDCDEAKEEIVKILQDSSSKAEILIENETDALKRVKSEIFLEISPKNAKRTPFYRSVTSPICPNHIVPEVEVESPLNQLSLAEKRKIFTKQESFDCGNLDETQNSSKILSVLDVLDINSGNLVTTKSLPNISEINSNELDENKSFKERKEYWERLSSISSSNDSLSTFECITVPKNSKRSWKTSSSDRFTSVDSSIEDCSVIPLEERRKQLLKQFENTFFIPQISPVKIIDNDKKRTVQTSKDKKAFSRDTVTSQFKRAVNYFKSLEDNNSRQNEIYLSRGSTNCETKELPEFIRSFFH